MFSRSWAACAGAGEMAQWNHALCSGEALSASLKWNSPVECQPFLHPCFSLGWPTSPWAGPGLRKPFRSHHWRELVPRLAAAAPQGQAPVTPKPCQGHLLMALVSLGKISVVRDVLWRTIWTCCWMCQEALQKLEITSIWLSDDLCSLKLSKVFFC